MALTLRIQGEFHSSSCPLASPPPLWLPIPSPPCTPAAYEGLELRIKGDGKRYKLIIRCDPGWDSVGYTKSFDTQPGGQRGVQQDDSGEQVVEVEVNGG